MKHEFFTHLQKFHAENFMLDNDVWYEVVVQLYNRICNEHKIGKFKKQHVILNDRVKQRTKIWGNQIHNGKGREIGEQQTWFWSFQAAEPIASIHARPICN